MQYRKFGKLDWKVSALGFGAMRLPLLNSDEQAGVDENEAIKMIRHAVDNGVNYVDSAYMYHGGKSEIVVGKALKDGYREKVHLATKLPPQEVKTASDFDRILNEQLKKLQTDKIDFYLIHGVRKGVWQRMRDLGYIHWAEGAIADGRIGHIGFSFHDDFATFKEIIDGYDNWTFCQIQYNYMDENIQAGIKGLKYAHKKDLAVVVMEPVRGGRISKPPAIVAKAWGKSLEEFSPSGWALRWVWNHPEVSVALSGMTTMEQLKENLVTAEYSKPHNLSADELELIGRVRDAYKSLSPIPCTGCNYCMPCPNGVGIPQVFELYNEASIYGTVARSRRSYSNTRFFKEEQRADNCIKCEECLEKCPQKLPIPELLEKAHAFLMGKND